MHRAMLTQEDAVAVGAVFAGAPIGLALAGVSEASRSASILSVAVAPAFRGQGVGTALLRQLEQEVMPCCDSAEAVFTDGSEYSDAVRRLLVKQGWGPIRPRMLICKSNRERIFQAPWMHQPPLPDEFEIFRWCDLSETEKAEIRERRYIQYPDIESPFEDEDWMEPVSSLGLRHRGVVAGWMITHILEPDTLRFTRMFVRQDLQRRARAISLLAESIRRFAAQPIVERVFNAVWGIHVENVPMMHFARRRLAPWSTAMYYSYGASRLFRTSAAD